jgi:hypothetical protein
MRMRVGELRAMIRQEARAIGSRPRRETNKELFARYAAAFDLNLPKRGLPGGQWVILDKEDDDFVGHMETSDGAYARGPVFWLRQFREDQWSGRQEDSYTVGSDDAFKPFTRDDLERAIAEKRPLHDTQPDRRTKKGI